MDKNNRQIKSKSTWTIFEDLRGPSNLRICKFSQLLLHKTFNFELRVSKL